MGGKFPVRAAELSAILERHGLAFISGWYSAKVLERDTGAEIAAIRNHLDLLAEMGCRVMVFAEGSGTTQSDRTQPAGRHRQIPEAEWPGYAKRVQAVAEHMQARGVQLAFHHHMGTAVQTRARVDELLRRTRPALGPPLGTRPAPYAGIDPPD